MTTFVRWRTSEPREGRVFDPLPFDHPAVLDLCPACQRRLGTVHPVQLLAIGPTDEEDQEIHRAGRWYNALALIFHAVCLGTEVTP